MTNSDRISAIKALLKSVPSTPWHFSPGDDFDHWEIWSDDGTWMVQDDSDVDPDQNFINFILQAKNIIEELLKEIEQES